MRRIFASALLALLPGLAQAQGGTLRAVLNLELQVLDPIITTSNVTRAYGYLVYDTLISMDAEGRYRPQMLEGWEASEDQLTWTFRLRPGLEWHDGKPVTAEDCVASLERWGRRDGLGSRLMAAAKGFRVVDAATFVLELREPFSQVIEAIGKPAAQIPFMMPARLAATEISRPVPESTGSGPYTFDRGEWRQGDRAIFRRNPRYKPREDAADGLAGGKVAHFERVDFVSLPDFSTRVAALQAGEVDYLEFVPTDFIARLQRDRNVRLINPRPIAQMMGAMAINHLHPPFNNRQVRRALQLAMDQGEIIAGLGLPAAMSMPWCQSIFMCGGPYASEAGTERLREPSIETAREALRASGYNNEPVVLLHSTDSVTLNPMALVIIDRLKRAGFNLDVLASDYSSQAQRRLSREPPGRGGWSLMPLVFTGYDILNPLAHYAVAYNCGQNYPGWPCAPALTPLLEQFGKEPDAAKRQAIAAEMQRIVHDEALMLFNGQFSVPAAHREDVRDVLPVGFPVFWNMRRAAR
ncbi:ABC transporter substrate-binding protein [Siccirubricoccus sp. KC 17139]|uniref:ABC transporter substrate-binding protein n=1 Tax=Siccirubricoccus soli TaxID=2899147 RepID=A0ABT1DD60_9PROT|nr:ABC transporter substrate-binding protein [Siccirubricoccus soli]MCO6419873.1 ABC transporter substrate-binding protein [Siccirubricoccus soli]MCP2686008.1 ABC transporter substrate-binding protein [Siccirubricoccus soli]